MGKLFVIGVLSSIVFQSAAVAKEVVIRVDAKSGPWRTEINPKLSYGRFNARAPAILMDSALRPAIKLRISATGQTSTVVSGQSFGPDGQAEWTTDRGAALFPSYYMSKRNGAIHLNELVGAFIDADGKVVGPPFPIGKGTEIVVPDGAFALSMGINDDNYVDNGGALMVRVVIPEPNVTVEPADDK